MIDSAGSIPYVALLIGAPQKMLRTFFKKVFPWIVALAIFGYLFHQYPPQNIYNALKFMNIPFFCAAALAYFSLMFLTDTCSISRVLKLFGHAEKVRELIPARGTTYLVMLINYAAAQAAFAFYQYRKHGIPISKMLGIFGVIVVVDLFLLAALAFVTTFFTSWPLEIAGMNIATFVRIFTAALFTGFLLLVAAAKWSAEQPLVKRLRKNKLVDLVVTTGAGTYAGVALARLPVHAFIMGGMYLAVRTFYAEIPLLKILSNIPLVFFIGSLPITPGGLGTSNAVFVELFKPFVTSPAIADGSISAGDLLFSFSLIWLFANYVMKALTGIICLRFVSRDLFRPTPEVPEEEAEREAPLLGGQA